MTYLIFGLILVPIAAGIVNILFRKNLSGIAALLTVAASAIDLVLAISLFGKEVTVTYPWAMFGIDLSLRVYSLNSFVLLFAGIFGILIALFSVNFMKGRAALNQFYSYFLLTLGLTNGAVLSDNLIVMLFFWEALLLVLFGMIIIGNKHAWKTASKAFIIVGISDVCLLIGIALTGFAAGTFNISNISLPVTSAINQVAFVMLMLGAISKAGSMPFHSWIPDAAKDAPLPFMALVPAALEKLLGIYFLARICLDIFKLTPESWLCQLMMIIGCITIIIPVMMALVQKDYKKLLSYHAISQVGYMILGVGTGMPLGIAGGIFHMINHATYKSCLFLTGGSVEKQAGSTSLEALGGLAAKMPITFACFIVAAFSISGVPPFNGFFSKEMIYQASLDRGLFFYICAAGGSFLTAASFLKLGHAAYLGPVRAENKSVKESPLSMTAPMIVLAGICVFFGLFNKIPVGIIGHAVAPRFNLAHIEEHANIMLIAITIVVIIAALAHHYIGYRMNGSGLKAVEHIHNAPVLSNLYDRAEKRYFDPYCIWDKLINGVSYVLLGIDRLIDFVFDGLCSGLSNAFSYLIRWAHNGLYAVYIAWAVAGALFVIYYILR